MCATIQIEKESNAGKQCYGGTRASAPLKPTMNIVHNQFYSDDMPVPTQATSFKETAVEYVC